MKMLEENTELYPVYCTRLACAYSKDSNQTGHARIQEVLSEGVQLNSINVFLVEKVGGGSKYH